MFDEILLGEGKGRQESQSRFDSVAGYTHKEQVKTIPNGIQITLILLDFQHSCFGYCLLVLAVFFATPCW